MIELAFSESAAGGLKYAKSMTQGERLSGAVGVIGGTRKERRSVKTPRAWTGVTMEGGSRDVAALTLALDIGDLSDMDAGMDGRKRVLDHQFGDFADVSDTIWRTNQHTLARIREARSTLEPIRLWICPGDPGELCGLYCVCYIMGDSGTPLSVVRIPGEIERDGGITWYRGTGEVPAEELGALAAQETPVSALMRCSYATLWSGLTRENAPLRAVVNGRIMGVPADFYDFALRAQMPEGECRVAHLIGRTLGEMPGVGDRWLFLRIREMIAAGELIEVLPPEGDHPYSGTVRRRNA